MKTTLYLEDNQLILTDDIQDKINIFHYDFTIIPLLISKIKKENWKEAYLYHPEPEKALEDIKKYFDLIEGAGGIVFNEKNEILFIYRRGIWDLPKGKIEQNESADQAALREVKEECGIGNLKLIGFHKKTHHIFKEKGRRKMKITHWYIMQASSHEKTNPQKIEGIEKVEWLEPQQVLEQNIYTSIKHLIRELNRFY